ncbi:MAG: TIGR00282 family metallophosphoesterase [Ruminococcaceae bacterium]|nr:TIGR00282 family metallophosphoesterase [Oscillospiraceae bacterium]
MKILIIGDVVGICGTEFLKQNLHSFAKDRQIDMIIANGENAAKNNGLDKETAEMLFASGVDVITSGNHIWHKFEMQNIIDDYENILRPANYPGNCPGNGYVIYNAGGVKVLVISVLGTVYLESLSCPFETVERIINREEGNYDISIVDIHAEATSEKAALARYFDGRLTAVVGTHTHVQTADERLLPNGTAFITDLGMTGAYESILGVNCDRIINKFLTKMPTRFEQAEGECQFNAVILDVDNVSYKAKSIERVFLIK